MAEDVNLRSHNRLDVLGITPYKSGDEERSFWTKIGSAFWNRDGSLNIKLDYVPVNLPTQGIQIRPPRERTDAVRQPGSGGADGAGGPF